MTKEEIVDKHIGLWSIKNPDYIHNSYLEAMDEWAKQESIAFAEWVSNNQWNFLQWGATKGSGWHKGQQYKVPAITTEQLYSLFKQQSKNKQP